MQTSRPGEIRQLLRGGDRRSIADSNQVRLLVENNPSLVGARLSRQGALGNRRGSRK